jgi:hypothetical protein
LLLIGTFATVALLLAAIGVFGVIHGTGAGSQSDARRSGDGIARRVGASFAPCAGAIRR